MFPNVDPNVAWTRSTRVTLNAAAPVNPMGTRLATSRNGRKRQLVASELGGLPL